MEKSVAAQRDFAPRWAKWTACPNNDQPAQIIDSLPKKVGVILAETVNNTLSNHEKVDVNLRRTFVYDLENYGAEGFEPFGDPENPRIPAADCVPMWLD